MRKQVVYSVLKLDLVGRAHEIDLPRLVDQDQKGNLLHLKVADHIARLIPAFYPKVLNWPGAQALDLLQHLLLFIVNAHANRPHSLAPVAAVLIQQLFELDKRGKARIVWRSSTQLT